MQIISDTNIGGAGIWIKNFDASYSKDKIELTIVMPRGAALKAEIKNGRVIECDMAADSSLDNSSTEILTAIIAAEKPDIVHTHGSLSGRLAARNAKTGSYILYTKHTLSAVPGGIKKLMRSFVDNRTCDTAIACSNCAKKNLIDCGLKKKKIVVIYNGCAEPAPLDDAEKDELRAKYGISKDDFVFTIVARLAPVKDHATFFRAAAAADIKGAKFLIAGGGPLEEELHKFVEQLGISDRCVFTGQLPGAEKLYMISDVCCLSSLSENMPISLIESMAAGVPAIATRVGGMEEVAISGETALMFEAGDDEAMRAHMETLYSDKELRVAMGLAARMRFKERFTLEKATAEIEKIYLQRGNNDEE